MPNQERTTTYLVDETQPFAQVVEERDADGVLQKRYFHGLEMGPVRQDQQNAQAIGGYLTSYYLPDGLDSTRQLTDLTGAVTDSYYYDTFGEGIGGDSGHTPNNYRFNGQQLDGASGLYYLRARYYDQGLGRFLSQDPMMGNSDDPVSLHRYLYAANNPVNAVDPSGEYTVAQAVVVSAITGGIMGGISGGVHAYVKNQSILRGVAQGAAFGATFGAVAGAVAALWPVTIPYMVYGGTVLNLANSGLQFYRGDRFLAGFDLVMGLLPAAGGKWLQNHRVETQHPNYAQIAQAQVPDPPEPTFDVFQHGSAEALKIINSQGQVLFYAKAWIVAMMIRRDPRWQGQPIRLFACETGSTPTGLAKQLSNLLKVKIWAPKGKTWVKEPGPDGHGGDFYIGDDLGNPHPDQNLVEFNPD